MNTLVQKALSAGITLVGGIVGSRVVAGGWRLVTGHSAPDDAADETLPLVEALSFAFISAGVAALLKVAGQRGAGAEGGQGFADLLLEHARSLPV